uniref:SLC12 domain-containing protein n=1 Tax=Macrostomum lignano TaxID=282301 RepID=A0A1I8F104_9PLAT
MPLACLGPGRQPAAGSSLRAACQCLNVDLLVTVACSSSSQSNDNDSLKLLMSKLHAVSASSSALGNSLSIQPSLPAHLNLPKGQSWLSSPTADWAHQPHAARICYSGVSASTGSASSVMYQDLTDDIDIFYEDWANDKPY